MKLNHIWRGRGLTGKRDGRINCSAPHVGDFQFAFWSYQPGWKWWKRDHNTPPPLRQRKGRLMHRRKIKTLFQQQAPDRQLGRSSTRPYTSAPPLARASPGSEEDSRSSPGMEENSRDDRPISRADLQDIAADIKQSLSAAVADIKKQSSVHLPRDLNRRRRRWEQLRGRRGPQLR